MSEERGLAQVRQENERLRAEVARLRPVAADAARMLAKWRGMKTEGAMLLDRLEEALGWKRSNGERS